jgi:hypothetical protein
MVMNVLLALLAVIVVAIAASMFLDDNTMSYFINRPSDVPILDTIGLTNDSNIEFFMNTQISDDIPNHY